MDKLSPLDTQPVPVRSAPSKNSLFLLTLLIGVLMGIVIMCMVGYGLYFFGYITLIDDVSIQPTVQSTEVTPLVCPTCEPATAESMIIVVTPTLSPTATLDFGATATAACATFNQQFPGTPCPGTTEP